MYIPEKMVPDHPDAMRVVDLYAIELFAKDVPNKPSLSTIKQGILDLMEKGWLRVDEENLRMVGFDPNDGTYKAPEEIDFTDLLR